MESLRRANKLWTNDNLHLRDYLLIPVTPSDLQTDSLCSQSIHKSNGLNSVPQAFEIVTRQDLQIKTKCTVPRSKSCTASIAKDCDQQTCKADTDSLGNTAKDFFSKLDTNIAQLKRSVEQLDATSK